MLGWYAKVIAVVLAVVVPAIYAFDYMKTSTDSRLNEEALKILKTWEQIDEGYAVVEVSVPEGCSIVITSAEVRANGKEITKTYSINLPSQTPITITGSKKLKISKSKIEVLP